MLRNALLLPMIGTVALTALMSPAANSAEQENDLLAQARQIFSPLPKDMATAEFPLTPEKVELGHKLFFDPRMSADGSASCSRCHLPSLYGTDGLAKSLGAHGKLNARNAPTVLNAALQFKAHWIGDRENIEDQAKRALLGPASFGNPDYASAMAKLKAIAEYPRLFEKAFPGESDPVTPDNWAKAIGAYERTLVTPSRFDQFLAGDPNALSAAERNGLRIFIETGCAACHNGPGVGGTMFQKFGVTEDYWKETGVSTPDKGRFDVTKDLADLYVFRCRL